ncbi:MULTISPECIES: hypothetical protein [unclassified Kaistella]|uniref:hypothetical protein n=1 Tax=unclassified Kaistella TaxID=2762626 RepID=UPI00273327B9|nr:MULTISPECIES: hypothetical protein [unclassified Kaistella]MDP2453362.1 hypothetical protein [Kaistella sp. SH11-4b]MDP2456419.1 hypothetical protein [Kaistella sp. SH40-3]MDP2459175.1 hypothetical protein [Kaistella sp. SH19-2b]
MKTLFSFSSILLLVIILFSCGARETAFKTIDTVNPLSNRFTTKSDLNRDISSNKIIDRISRDAGLEKNQKLSDIKLRKLTQSEKDKKDANKPIYVLQAKSTNGISIAHIFSTNGDETALISEGKTCKCTSTQCAHGCNAEIFGGNCGCSHCSAECKKESTVTEEEEG